MTVAEEWRNKKYVGWVTKKLMQTSLIFSLLHHYCAVYCCTSFYWLKTWNRLILVIHSDEGLTPETLALKLFKMANLCYQLSW